MAPVTGRQDGSPGTPGGSEVPMPPGAEERWKLRWRFHGPGDAFEVRDVVYVLEDPDRTRPSGHRDLGREFLRGRT